MNRVRRSLTVGTAAWLAAVVALIAVVGIAQAPHPPGIFLKYPRAAAWTAAELAARAVDLSPLYLALNRLQLSLGAAAVLWLQCVLHAACAAAVAVAVGRVGGGRWGLGAGLLAATYPPFLVHAGIHEPETAIVCALAVALAAAASARVAVGRGRFVLAAVCGLTLGIAGGLRPQHWLLIPLFAVWLGVGSPRWRGSVTGLLLGAGVLIAPLLASSAGGGPRMNPGSVLYEGNGPGATGVIRHAPRLVRALERAHPEVDDYGHVAYRRIAAASLGAGQIDPATTNRYWLGLTVEGMRAYPGSFLRRLARKALHAWMPREAHDLRVSEDLERRVRRRLPWGFAVLLVPSIWLLLVRGPARVELVGAAMIAATSWLIQVAFYVSARQRLPLALALIVAGTLAVREWWLGRLRVPRWPALGLAAIGATVVIYGTTQAAIADQIGWDDSIPASDGRLAAVLDGRAWRPGEWDRQRRFAAGVAAVRTGQDDGALELLTPLAGDDFTADDDRNGVVDYWRARAALRIGDLALARTAIERAELVRPDDLEVQALASVLRDGCQVSDFRPAGVDPYSARLALGRACGVVGDARVGDARAGFELLAPLLGRFPELAPELPP